MSTLQETSINRLTGYHLKLIALITMAIDHVAAVVIWRTYVASFRITASMQLSENIGDKIIVWVAANQDAIYTIYEWMRYIGRMAFPIYCFLLAEGSAHTKDPGRYALRLTVMAVLSEIPFDIALHRGINWSYQNVMFSLLLGLGALEGMKRTDSIFAKLLTVLPFALLAELAGTDYGAKGVLLMALFGLTRGHKWAIPLQFFGMWFLFSPNHAMFLNWLGGIRITVQEYALLAVIPIACYSGKKLGSGKAAQWGFYLFYPVHLLVLWLMGRIYGSIIG